MTDIQRSKSKDQRSKDQSDEKSIIKRYRVEKVEDRIKAVPPGNWRDRR